MEKQVEVKPSDDRKPEVAVCVGCGEEYRMPSKHNHDDFCDKCTDKENGAD